MWGGIGPAGFGLVMYHAFRKVDSKEWCDAVKAGSLKAACQSTSGKRYGPWCIICDNESFLKSRAADRAHAKTSVELWHVPARSPDLNPVEMYWAKLRLWLRKMDLDDFKAGRTPVDKKGMQQRVRRLLAIAKAKRVAINIFSKLRPLCEEVMKRTGGSIRG